MLNLDVCQGPSGAHIVDDWTERNCAQRISNFNMHYSHVELHLFSLFLLSVNLVCLSSSDTFSFCTKRQISSMKNKQTAMRIIMNSCSLETSSQKLLITVQEFVNDLSNKAAGLHQKCK